MIRMKDTIGAASLNADGQSYPVVNGVLEVPPHAVKHALRHGFLLLEGGKPVTDDNLEAAIAAASAPIVVSLLLQAPEGVASANFDGSEFPVDEKGQVSVPASAVSALARLGFTLVASDEEPKPAPANTVPLTAVEPTQEELDAAAAKLEAEKAKPFDPEAATDDELKAWLKERDITVVGPNRERMINAIKKQLAPKE